MDSDIELYFPKESISAIKRMGLVQAQIEGLVWQTDPPESSDGRRVLIRKCSGEILDGKAFAALVYAFGAGIDVAYCDDTFRQVHRALYSDEMGTQGSISYLPF